MDTNVLIYAYDSDAGYKHERARALLEELWKEEGGIISTQVLQELYVNVTQMAPTPMAPTIARGVLGTYAAWQVELNDLATIPLASEVQERHTLSFSDALIVAAASTSGAEVLRNEHLNHGQVIEGVRVHHPLSA